MSGEVIPFRHHDLGEGDAVRFRGGPIMLVAVADAELMFEVQCLWFAGPRGSRRLSVQSFDGRDLTLVARHRS